MSRIKSIAELALDVLYMNWDQAALYFSLSKLRSFDRKNNRNYEICLQSWDEEGEFKETIIFKFEEYEFNQLKNQEIKGNTRTQELLATALVYLNEHIDYAAELYNTPIDGYFEFGKTKIKFPNTTEVEHVLKNITTVTKKFPPVVPLRPVRKWDIYFEDDIIDTQYFVAKATKEHVYRSLVEDYDFSPDIQLAWKGWRT